MNLELVFQQYAAFRKTLGERFATNAHTLKAFCRAMGPEIEIAEVSPKKVSAFLVGKGPLTTSWYVRHNALVGFYRYAISRGFVTTSPLPVTIPKISTAFRPYIYSLSELWRMLDAAETSRRSNSDLDASVLHALILLMYGAALRPSEVLSLTMSDVDLCGAIITIRDSKFFTSRLVPVGPKTVRVLVDYTRHRDSAVRKPKDPFFVDRNSKQIPIHKFERAFKQIRLHAGLRREGGSRCQPRLHDLRHTSAVHRLISWYREGKDVQKLLPQLSVYMGHRHLSATQTYISLTPDLLHQANLRFERYATPGGR
jgi:site-specific recombinase XerD